MGISTKSFLKSVSPAHLPTLMLVIGYPIYWVELYFFPARHGVTSWLATLLFLLVSFSVFLAHGKSLRLAFADYLKQFLGLRAIEKFYILTGGILIFVIISCVFYASLLPPHLPQESDALTYHLALPRQHLILNSFKHIPWAADDLFLLPVDFALAPFWLVTQLPNKFPQFLFLLGLVFISVSIVNRLGGNATITKTAFILFAIFGSHHFGIQMGTAMLDLVICYLFVAALDSFLRKAYALALIEFTFFFWAKSLVPLQMVLTCFLMGGIFLFLTKIGVGKLCLGFTGVFEKKDILEKASVPWKMFAGFVLLSLFIAGPFIGKSLYYAGTPLYPFMPGSIGINKDIQKNEKAWQSKLAASRYWVNNGRNSYGHGRSPSAFVKHFWLIAVPEKGVNNKYDYPVGLAYLIFLGPFLFKFFSLLSNKKIPIIALFIICYWLTWWMGSQQTRFLYIPILLMFIVVLAEIRIYSKTLMGVLAIAVSINAVSILRAHENDFGKMGEQVLRSEDRRISAISKQYLSDQSKNFLNLNDRHVAFAQFPAMVVQEQLPHTLAF